MSIQLKKLFTGVICAIAIAFTCEKSICVMASDAPVIEREDPEDAEKGHVYVRAVVEKGCSISVHVDLLPEFEEGVSHSYTLDDSCGYGVGDDIMVGTYGCICYAEGYDSDVTAAYGGGSQEVASGEGNETYFVVVAGSKDFVSQYEWLTNYTDSNGEHLRGYITRSEAKKISEAPNTGEDVYPLQEEPIEENPPEEYESPAVNEEPEEAHTGSTEETIEEPDSGQEHKDINMTVILTAVGIIAAAAVVFTARYIIRRKEE